MPFEMRFKGKKDAFLRNTVNKHSVINAILTELKKPGYPLFHSYDDADIDMTKLPVQSSLKYLIQLTLVFTNMVFTEFLNISNKKSRFLHFG